ncbi:MAG TPA: hypothetical protein VGQ38_09700 [Gaiellaceae bacterium]|nr:hypothetical protein [Gaiellaceae bacterium]
MGWQDRDYAKFTEAERDRFFGSSSLPSRSRGRSGSGLLLLLGLTVAGMFVLPHLEIAGHHYRLFFF